MDEITKKNIASCRDAGTEGPREIQITEIMKV